MCIFACLPITGYTPVSDASVKMADDGKKIAEEVRAMMDRAVHSGLVDAALIAKANEHLELWGFYFTKAVLNGPGATEKIGEPTP